MNGYIDDRLRVLLSDADYGAIHNLAHTRKDSEDRYIEKIATWIPVTDETLIDAGYGTPEMIARDEARRAESRARWLALPFYVRWYRRLGMRWAEFRNRFDRARRAWNGDDE